MKKRILILTVLTAIYAEATTPVKVQTVANLLTTVEHSAPASVVSLQQPAIAAETTARIIEVPVKPGEQVKQGDLLVQLDCTDYQFSLGQTKAEMDALVAQQTLATQQLSRLTRLSKNQNISEDQINQQSTKFNVVKAQIAVQKIRITNAQHAISKCTIISPFNGLVEKVSAQVGSYVTPGRVLINLIDLKQIELVAYVNDSFSTEISFIKQFQYIYSGQRYSLKIRTIFANVDPISKDREIRLTFITNKPPPVGSSGRLHWFLPQRHLPAWLVVKRNNRYGIFIGQGEQAVFHSLDQFKPGKPFKTGLADDVLLITEGRHNLTDNDKITITTIK